jgi:hypothetical protein
MDMNRLPKYKLPKLSLPEDYDDRVKFVFIDHMALDPLLWD